MKIATIIGARPQFIKAAVLSRIIQEKKGITEVIVHTGQHFDANMSDIFFEEMSIPRPAYNLHIHGLSHGEMTGQMLGSIEKILLDERPDFVLVYGDTNSTIAGALAAKKIHIKVAHVEAGLRSFNMRMPEEINRIVTDRLSDIAFCPTDQAVENLKKEGFDHFPTQLVRTGDIMYDAALYYANQTGSQQDALSKYRLQANNYVLGTIHRAENTDDTNRLQEIITGLNMINSKMPVIVPLHPRTRAIIQQRQLKIDFTIIEPVGYIEMINLTRQSKMVITDSGGLQKEACFFGKYCITTRDETEWIELVNNQINELTGANAQRIVSAFEKFNTMNFPQQKQLYGNGKSGEVIYENLLQYHKNHS